MLSFAFGLISLTAYSLQLTGSKFKDQSSKFRHTSSLLHLPSYLLSRHSHGFAGAVDVGGAVAIAGLLVHGLPHGARLNARLVHPHAQGRKMLDVRWKMLDVILRSTSCSGGLGLLPVLRNLRIYFQIVCRLCNCFYEASLSSKDSLWLLSKL